MNKVDDTERNGGELDDALHVEGAESADKPKGKKRKAENPEEKEARLKREAAELEEAIGNFVVAGTIKTRVAWILNMFPQTRDSDIALSLKYWELYNADVYSKLGIAPIDLFKLERITSIVRVRAKIQNEYRLFPPSDEVRRHRRSIEDDMKEAAVEDKPQRNIVFVFADETGKTGDFVIVAAVWVLDGSTLVKTSHAISSWQATSPWASGEIHFAEFKKHHVDALPGYLDLINRNRQFLSFKTINTERAKTRRPPHEIVQRLHEYMMIRGAAHEIESNRIKLPYEVSLTMDEDHSLDEIARAQIGTSIGLSYQLQYGDSLRVYGVKSAPSHGSQMLQLADVIAGAVNRKLNHKGDRGYKDDMADMIVERLDIKIDPTDLPDIDSSAALSI